MTGGVAVLNIGCSDRNRIEEKKARIEDALHATRAAVAEESCPRRRSAPPSHQDLDTLKLEGDEATGAESSEKGASLQQSPLPTTAVKKGNMVAKKYTKVRTNYG